MSSLRKWDLILIHKLSLLFKVCYCQGPGESAMIGPDVHLGTGPGTTRSPEHCSGGRVVPGNALGRYPIFRSSHGLLGGWLVPEWFEKPMGGLTLPSEIKKNKHHSSCVWNCEGLTQAVLLPFSHCQILFYSLLFSFPLPQWFTYLLMFRILINLLIFLSFAQESLLAGHHLECRGWNPGGPRAGQTSSPPSYCCCFSRTLSRTAGWQVSSF